ncbi:5,6-dimethylbenzimidazole synthase [Echinimonas agarilytica]|uniref:5,6-dimethylbenzimidazole synthase n=1 Tax=Echinimonas agarilytica TaxID=1215918 RepID=A0AA41W4H4_9GAMM|nr:5,6-dimethylbenzimidazole synthase [Echinimonas agarilytica]MCM2678605.1 5,6-dimethylbenzimidazole synthase [Echinimonas agarilytica]
MQITQEERDSVYKTIFARRDVRREFLPDAIPDDVLKRVLTAAHHAPSVGYMQPWDFVLVRSDQTKARIKSSYLQAHQQATEMFASDKKETYQKLKLEGIMEAPLGICVTCDRSRNGPVVIGTTAKPDMDLYSTVCAIQNLWLAARAENLGVGWVSILHDDVLYDTLNIPQDISIVAYLCVGYVSQFNDKPELEKLGWLPRRPIDDVIHVDTWQPTPKEP